MTRLFLALLILTLSAAGASAQPAGDSKRGGMLFLQCRACHPVEAGKKLATGPNLHGVVGRKSASDDYAFSPALSSANLIWDAATLDQWLTKPNALVPGTKMAFAGISNPKDRADLIAYLASLGPVQDRSP
jgi:cytochrome c